MRTDTSSVQLHHYSLNFQQSFQESAWALTCLFWRSQVHVHYLHGESFGKKDEPELQNMTVVKDTYTVTSSFRCAWKSAGLRDLALEIMLMHCNDSCQSRLCGKDDNATDQCIAPCRSSLVRPCLVLTVNKMHHVQHNLKVHCPFSRILNVSNIVCHLEYCLQIVSQCGSCRWLCTRNAMRAV